jgi:hypothetical protein
LKIANKKHCQKSWTLLNEILTSKNIIGAGADLIVLSIAKEN